jgi:hypothetical protein
MKTKEEVQFAFDSNRKAVYCEIELWGTLPDFHSNMGKFGEDLRMERMSRGVALEDITAVTKISRHHLVALEQEKFRQLPGGILSKGIVRGYTGALGLDQQVWTDRFLSASNASGITMEDDSGWTAFASNVGKSRILRHDALEMRMRWAGAVLLFLMMAVATFLAVRYLGVREGRWMSVMPGRQSAAIHINPPSILPAAAPAPPPAPAHRRKHR